MPQRPAGQALTPYPGHYWEVPASSLRGLFVWNPVTLVATIGFLFVEERTIRAACLLAFLLQVAVNRMLATGGAASRSGAARPLADAGPPGALVTALSYHPAESCCPRSPGCPGAPAAR